ncbi:methyltransferase domain-containing protein [Bartonella tamiae]|uniref:Methyltransferase type 11 domain-containing protein n=1 Tax=Bartonella tamiae Th239 TaxID=1094558 RepID=J0R4A3_9HYPH|nr:methyltransferase domain-containing protein [Bartonella tamiae]EJF90464.1 hypothetical protein ME5_00865 [Bartonella tamiae Th239]EJF93592.1 hypothetical protein MEG_01016 [Bartonella tamiae Th307]
MSQHVIFDQILIEKFRQRAFEKYGTQGDFLLAHVLEDLQERIANVDRNFALTAYLHSHTSSGIDALKHSNKIHDFEVIETDERYGSQFHTFHRRDREFLDLPIQHFDLIVSLLSLHIVNDVPGVLTQIKRSLKPDGLFLGVLPGAGTLGELRETFLQAETEIYGGASPRIYPFMDIRDAGALLQRVGFAMPVTDVENITVRYDSTYHIMRDLRAMGMQNALFKRSRKMMTKRFFERVNEIYSERFSDCDGRIRASFSFIWLSGWAPDDSQQKPMKPGTAKVSLIDALAKNNT